MNTIKRLRNIGISAHVDAGKTTLAERILLYTGNLRQAFDGRSSHGLAMDATDIEKRKGITISAACTQCQWRDITINLIDTPGHVDFTIEVERALKVLDGAVLVLCGVSGVQAQTFTVSRQMDQHRLPRVVFVNKLDADGADPARVVRELRDRLGLNAVAFQLPIGLGRDHRGVVDVLTGMAYVFRGQQGEDCVAIPVPDELQAETAVAREALMDAIAELDDELLERRVAGADVPLADLQAVVRQATIDRSLVPVFMGAAYRNIGVQPLLDAVCHYLPSPDEVVNVAYRDDNEVEIACDAAGSTVAFVFKLEEDPHGQLSYLRVYRGTVKRGDTLVNTATGNRLRVGRLVRMRIDERVDIEETRAGDVVALIGCDCDTGTTFTDGADRLSLSPLVVPDPVIDVRVDVQSRTDVPKLAKALNRYVREDPTFHVRADPETGDIVMSGMGELHLAVYVEKLKEDHGIDVTLGRPQIACRETITEVVTFDEELKKQSGGPGVYARIAGRLEPFADGYVFESRVKGGAISASYLAATDAGFRETLAAGRLAGFPVTGLKVVITDGAIHEKDSSELAFKLVAHQVVRAVYQAAKPILLEPIMTVEIATPTACQGAVLGNLASRRGRVLASEAKGETTVITASVPLAEMFGYVGDLRSMTHGHGAFSMSPRDYAPAPEIAWRALQS